MRGIHTKAGDTFGTIRLAEGGVQKLRKSKKRLSKTNMREYTNTQTYEQTIKRIDNHIMQLSKWEQMTKMTAKKCE
jgi:hypothetical protein